jgi:hypothetical protein
MDPQLLARIRRYLVKGYSLPEIAVRTKTSAAALDLLLWQSLGDQSSEPPHACGLAA